MKWFIRKCFEIANAIPVCVFWLIFYLFLFAYGWIGLAMQWLLYPLRRLATWSGYDND